MNIENTIMDLKLNNLAEQMFKIQEQARDNLFSANHRNAMKQRYGFTQAESIKLEDLNG